MHRHPDTFLELNRLGSTIPPYQPNYEFTGEFVNASQRAISNYPLQDGVLIQKKNRRWFGEVIPGWLRSEDALKLYELCYFCEGDILEFGCYHGLSTSIIAHAVRDSKRPRKIFTVDISDAAIDETKRHLRSLRLGGNVTALCNDAASATKDFVLKASRFGFIFVDHAHDFQSVYEVCRELGSIVMPGAFCLFHDFNDFRNGDPEYTDYAVYQGVIQGLDRGRFEFWGIYGCTGLYRSCPDRDSRNARS
jgi:SAM-dependent methyltransferase